MFSLSVSHLNCGVFFDSPGQFQSNAAIEQAKSRGLEASVLCSSFPLFVPLNFASTHIIQVQANPDTLAHLAKQHDHTGTHTHTHTHAHTHTHTHTHTQAQEAALARMDAEKVKADKSQLVIRSNKKLIAPQLTRSNFHHVHVTSCLVLMQYDAYVS
jgi:hypothetical protein